MKILLTGGAGGQVGWEVIQQCKLTQHELVALALEELDITDETQVQELLTLHQPDIVINAAAYTAVDKAEDQPEIAFKVNRDGTAYLARTCNNLKIPLLHISTDYVFDGEKTSPYQVNDKANPQNVYGASKWEGEQILRQTLNEHIILRTSWVFGSYGNNFVKTMLKLAETRTELGIVADQYGAPTSAQSIASCLLTLCERYEQNNVLPWGTYHFTGTPKTTWFDFANNIFKQAQYLNILEKQIKINPVTTQQYPTKAQRPINSQLDMQLTKTQLSISPPSWEDDLSIVLKTIKAKQ